MKRAVAVLLALVFAVSLTSCAGPEPAPSSDAGASTSDAAPTTTAEQSATEPGDTVSTTSAESRSSTARTTLRPTSSTTAPVTEKTTEKPPTAAPTTQSAQKAAVFTFSQTFPLEITSYGARFQILDAKISAVKMDAEGGCTFDFVCSAKRLEDGIAGKKTCALRVKWFNENGEQVKATGPAVGSLAVGETGRCNTTIGMKPSEMQGSPNNLFTVTLEGYGAA